MRILLIEDDAKIAVFIAKGLKQAGYGVSHCKDGQEGFTAATGGQYDLLMVDIMLPGLDGLSLIEQLRRSNMHTPVIIVSAKQSVDDRVRGLQAGGDDYITKPFAFAELLARIQAVTRRGQVATEEINLAVADLEMDLRARRVRRAGKIFDLPPREFALLEYLMRNAGRVVSKTMIIEHVWNYNLDPQANVVEAQMCRLREKVDTNDQAKLIHTIRGVGYVLRQEA